MKIAKWARLFVLIVVAPCVLLLLTPAMSGAQMASTTAAGSATSTQDEIRARLHAVPQGVNWNAKEAGCLAGVAVTGHRGMGQRFRRVGGVLYAENTPRSFTAATDRYGACETESDYQPGCAGMTWTQHDATMNRMTRGSGAFAVRCPRYVRRHPTKRTNDPVATAEQSTDAMNHSTTCLRQLELKSDARFTDDQLRVFAEKEMVSTKSDMCITFNSFDMGLLTRMHEIAKDVHAGFRYGWILHSYDACPTEMPSWVTDVRMTKTNATQACIEQVHELGKRVEVRFVNSVSDFQLWKSLGVDGVLTNSPQLVGALR